jgi:FkbM family methyltransferase
MSMRERLEQVVIKNLREEIRHFFHNDPALTSDRHRNEVDRLFRNLDDRAAGNLRVILERLGRAADPAARSYRDIFTPDEYAQYERVRQFEREIVRVGEYYQYGRYKLPVSRFGVETFLYSQGLDALQTAESIGRKAVIDVGAFVGDSALIFAERFPDSHLYCFEPDADNFAHAQTTFRLNNLDPDRVGLFNVALGARPGTGMMSGSSAASCLSAAEEDSGGRAVRVDTLDAFVERNALEVGLIKIDVEGYELQVLEGALETIRRWKPILLLSIYHHSEQFFGLKPFLEDLDLGYAFDFFQGVSGRITLEIMLLCEAR